MEMTSLPDRRRFPSIGWIGVLATVALLAVPLFQPASAYKEGPPIGSPASTHQFILDSGVVILGNDGHDGLADFIRGAFLEEMKRGTIRADETLLDSREHYHDPFTHGGLVGFKSAAVLCKEQFQTAVQDWIAGGRLQAAFHLGWAVHMVQDLTVPHHARLTPFDFHAEYEDWVLAHQHEAYIDRGGIYTFDTTLHGHFEDIFSPEDWVDFNAHASYDLFDDVRFGDEDGFRRSLDQMLPLAQKTTAGFLLMFFETVNQEPNAEIMAQSSGYVGQQIPFDASASSDDIALNSITWSFGDGTSQTGLHVIHIYDSPGTYEVAVAVVDVLSLQDIAMTYVEILTTPFLMVDIEGPSTVRTGKTVNLTATNVTSLYPIMSYQWFVGEQMIGSGSQIAVRFTSPGLVQVELLVRDQTGFEAYAMHVLRIIDDVPPMVSLASIYHVEVGKSLKLNGSDFVTANDISSCVWYINGRIIEDWNLELTFQESGTYVLVLNVQDSAGNIGEAMALVIVKETPDGLLLIALLIISSTTTSVLASSRFKKKRHPKKG